MAGVLNSSFEVLRGWPEGPAVDEFFTPKSGQTLVEGSICVIDTDGTLRHAIWTDVSGNFLQGSTDRRRFWLVVEGTGTNSSQSSGKVTAITGDMVVKTTNILTTDAFAADDRVSCDLAAGTSPGKLTAQTANSCVIGEVLVAKDSNNVVVVSLSL